MFFLFMLSLMLTIFIITICKLKTNSDLLFININKFTNWRKILRVTNIIIFIITFISIGTIFTNKIQNIHMIFLFVISIIIFYVSTITQDKLSQMEIEYSANCIKYINYPPYVFKYKIIYHI